MTKFTCTLFVLIGLLNFSCNKDKAHDPDNLPCEIIEISSTTSINGYGILQRLNAIWNGPVSSPTHLGSYPEWIVDFRPISASQSSAKNELDSLNDIFMSFFIAKIDCEYQMVFRNGGGFAGQVRNAYMILDSCYESQNEAFYRFVDPVGGEKRVYTDITFRQDSLLMHVYTNQYGVLNEPVTHMTWNAKRVDTSSTQSAIALFNYPKKESTFDFSHAFDNKTDAVFYNAASDPYPEEDQPYLGNSHVDITINNPSTPDPNKKVLIIISTEPLFNGTTFDPSQLKYRSRYVFVGANPTTGFDFNYMHPGNYYVNAVYDSNGDLNFSSGDYINSSFDVPFNLTNKGNAHVNVNINFQIP